MSDILSEVGEMWRDLKDNQKEAKAEAERRNKLLDYRPEHFDKCTYTPVQFYELVLRNIEWRKVPELKAAYVLIQERHVFSRKRLYLQLKRERLVFEICAAPFGTGYFVSSRLFDRRHGASIFTIIALMIVLAMSSFAFWTQYGTTFTIIAVGTVLVVGWSVMRYAAASATTWLDETLCELPIIGPIYESVFHPNTYFRQDTNTMYKKVVDKAFSEAIQDLKQEKGIRGDSPKAPAIEDLHRR